MLLFAETFAKRKRSQAFSQVTVLGVCAQSVYINLVFYCEGAGRGRFYRKITWRMKCRLGEPLGPGTNQEDRRIFL
jgi:hypothetical protein